MHMRILAALFGLLLPLSVVAGSKDPLPEQPDSDIGYPSPEAALAALRAKPGVSIREENDWIVVQDPGENAFWSIAGPKNPAHPSAVKRSFKERDGAMYLEMKVKCGAPKETCDELVRSFLDLNERMKEAIRREKS